MRNSENILRYELYEVGEIFRISRYIINIELSRYNTTKINKIKSITIMVL